MTFGEKVKQLRVTQNMTQDALADAAGITKASLSNYERNKRCPQYPAAEAIANALGVPVSELYEKSTDKSSSEDIPTVRRVENVHARRLKKLTAAFDKLSDEGQLELIKRAEELAYVPIYRILPLPEALQRYIYSQYQQTYEVSDDMESQEIYESDEGQDIEADIRCITLKREKGKCQSKWHFVYYQFPGRPDDSAVKEIVSQYESYENKQDRYSFVLDDEERYNQFISCHEDIRNQNDLGPGNNLLSGKPEITFFLINKDTWEIRDTDSSSRYAPGPDGI